MEPQNTRKRINKFSVYSVFSVVKKEQYDQSALLLSFPKPEED